MRLLKYSFIIGLIFLAISIGCKNKKKDSVFTTEDVNPNVRGSLFDMGEKGYSIKIPRLQWIVVQNKHRDVDLTLYNRSYSGSIEVVGHRTFRKYVSLENAISVKMKKFLGKEYKILEKKQVEIAGQKGEEVRASGEIKLREYKTYVPRVVVCSAVQKDKFTYVFTFICKPEEFDLCTKDYSMILDNFNFEKITAPKWKKEIIGKDFEEKNKYF